jgi:hypothetical protein
VLSSAKQAPVGERLVELFRARLSLGFVEQVFEDRHQLADPVERLAAPLL